MKVNERVGIVASFNGRMNAASAIARCVHIRWQHITFLNLEPRCRRDINREKGSQPWAVILGANDLDILRSSQAMVLGASQRVKLIGSDKPNYEDVIRVKIE